MIQKNPTLEKQDQTTVNPIIITLTTGLAFLYNLKIRAPIKIGKTQ